MDFMALALAAVELERVVAQAAWVISMASLQL